MPKVGTQNTQSKITSKMSDMVDGPLKRVKPHISDCATRRSPRQKRARLTHRAILEAAATVIDEIGWDKASTNRIAERAGVSIGSLYQYFGNKEAILAALREEHRKEVHVVVGLALDRLDDPAVPVEEALRGLFEEMIGLHNDNPVLTRVLADEVPQSIGGQDVGEESDHLVRWLKRVLEHRPDVRVQNVEAAAYIMATSIEALTRRLAHETPKGTKTDLMIDEMVAMFSSYLTGRRSVWRKVFGSIELDADS